MDASGREGFGIDGQTTERQIHSEPAGVVPEIKMGGLALGTFKTPGSWKNRYRGENRPGLGKGGQLGTDVGEFTTVKLPTEKNWSRQQDKM